MVVKLYTYNMSPSVRACLMACEIFNVPFEKIPIDIQAGEHLTPEFLKGQIVLTPKRFIEQELLDAVIEGYGFMEAFLSRTKYIAADHVTIADLAILAVMTSLTQIVPLDAQK
ncbi:unnamed protein product [Spodoptera exigua]|nr:unnamed protein product [Spodoptera exigua]